MPCAPVSGAFPLPERGEGTPRKPAPYGATYFTYFSRGTGMDSIKSIKELIPDYAKDVRLNLDSVLGRSSLPDHEAMGVALAAALAAKNGTLVNLLRQSDRLEEKYATAALSAATIMGMTNSWYTYVELVGRRDLQELEPSLRMTAYASHGGADERSFQMYSLAASIVGRCRSCTASHFDVLMEAGATLADLHEVGRIVAVVSAAANVLAAEGKT